MKKYTTIIFIIIIFLAIILMTFWGFSDNRPANTDTTDRKSVIIDAGHGGIDGGAVSADGTVEKDINLKIALKTKTFFELFGYDVIMTRETDKSIHDDSATSIKSQKTSDLHNRLKIADENLDSLLISIHQNKFSSGKSKGMQVFYSGNDADSKPLADSIQNFTKANINKDNDRQTKQITKDVYLIYNAKQPAVLVECGFLSNAEETKLLKTDSYQSKLAFCIFGGTVKFYG